MNNDRKELAQLGEIHHIYFTTFRTQGEHKKKEKAYIFCYLS
jgi:hypothetical protein